MNKRKRKSNKEKQFFFFLFMYIFLTVLGKISQEDIEELSKDIALFKKLKKKKISEEEFDAKFGIT